MATVGHAIAKALGPDVRDEFPGVPEAGRIVAPGSIEQAAEVLRTASTHGLSTVVWGGGTHQGLGYRIEPDVVVLTSQLSRVIDWQPDDLTVVVEGGMRIDSLEAQLAERGQSAVLPEVPGDATIGGVIASGASGWRRLRYGPTRDRLLEVVVATGDGRVVTGGGRVVKNVTGYDVPRLMVGSLGTLGLISRVCLKLWPVPPHSGTIQVNDAAVARRVCFRPLAIIETNEASAVFVAGTEEELAGQAADLGGAVTPGLVWPSAIDSPWRLSLRVPPADVVEAVGRVRALSDAVRFQASHGVGTIALGLDTLEGGSADSLRTWAERLGGALVVEQAPSEGAAWDPWGTPPASLELQRRVQGHVRSRRCDEPWPPSRTPLMGWVTADAPTRAELDACITCGLCLPVCPTFRLTGEESASPRGRLAAMAAAAEGLIAVDDVFADVMGFCLQCRACEVACPSMVPFGRAMEGARAEIAAQLPDRARSVRYAVLGRGLSSRTALKAATAGAAVAQRLRIQGVMPGPLGRMAGLRPLAVSAPSIVGTSLRPAGDPIGRAAVLAGCVMDPWFGAVHQATLGVLRMAGYEVDVPEDQTCCGALAAHDGAAEAARALAGRNVAAFAGYDVVVADAAGCTAHLKEYEHWAEAGSELAGRVRDVTEIVAHLIHDGRLPSSEDSLGDVAVQDPCHLRHAQRIVEEPREVLRAAGYTPVEIDPDGFCCGAAGVYMVLHPETSDLLGKQKADQVRAAGLSLVASANPGCEMQFRAHLGPGFRVAHPVELYWESVRPGGGNG